MSILSVIKKYPERLKFFVLLLCAAGGYFVISYFYVQKQEDLTLQIVNSSMRYAQSRLGSIGELAVKGDKLYAGGRRLSGSTKFVDEMLKNTGFGCTIFLGKTRVSTTAKAAGSNQRAIGTDSNDMIAKKVFEKGETFLGVTETIGKEWLIIYEPIKLKNGKIIGMMALFKERAEFIKGTNAFKLITAIILSSFCIIVFYYLRASIKAFKNLEKQQNEYLSEVMILTDFSVKIRNGNLDASAEQLPEGHVLAKSLLTMQENLKNIIVDTREVVTKAKDGDLKVRINSEDKKGAWKDLSEEINDLIASISDPMRTFNTVVKTMSHGDLTNRLPMTNKGDMLTLSENFNKALDNFNALLRTIHEHSEVVRKSTHEIEDVNKKFSENSSDIAQGIAEMNHGAQTQLTRVDESSNLLEAVLRSSEEMGTQALKINEGVQKGVDNSGEGEKMIADLTALIQEMGRYSDRMNDSFQLLTGSTTEITKIVSIISTIASQTHMLALNAAIEASKAGESGRGFGIVAEEIRKLSNSTRESAVQIKEQIDSVENNRSVAVEDIYVLNKTINLVGEQVEKASDAFVRIKSSSHDSLGLSKLILTSAESQIESIKHVVKLSENIVVIAEETAAGTEEITNAIDDFSEGMRNNEDQYERLTQMSLALVTELTKFKLDQ